MIPNGANVTYVGTWRTSLLKTADGIVAQVNQGLLEQGLHVRTFHSTANWFDNLSTTLVKTRFTVTLNIQIENDLGFDSTDDIISVIRHYVYDATGQYPESDSIRDVLMPGQGKPVPTGQPSDNTQTGCVAGSNNDLTGSFSIGCWFKNLTTSGLVTVGILSILAVVAVGLIFFAAPGLAATGARRAAGAAHGAAAA